MQRLFAFVALIAGACSAKPTPQPSIPSSPSNPSSHTTPITALVPAPHYAKLFVKGATFSYVLQSASSYWDDQDPKADASGNVDESAQAVTTCRVIEVKKLPGALAADLSCDPVENVDVNFARLGGVYTATREGLWRLDEMPDAAAIAALTPDTMLVGAVPVERTTTTPPGAEGHSTISITHEGNTWCWSQEYEAGDEGDINYCFAGGTLAFGNVSWAGGSSREITYQLVGGEDSV